MEMVISILPESSYEKLQRCRGGIPPPLESAVWGLSNPSTYKLGQASDNTPVYPKNNTIFIRYFCQVLEKHLNPGC
jgi:hypothetical protein